MPVNTETAQAILQALDDEIKAQFPKFYCLYHYNPNAAISGPVIYFNYCSWDLHHGNCLYRDKQIKIVVDGNFILLTTDILPTREYKAAFAQFDLGDPEFSVANIIEAISVYYRSSDKRYTAMPDLVEGR